MKLLLAILVTVTCLACLIHANEKDESYQDSYFESEVSGNETDYHNYGYWADFLNELNSEPEDTPDADADEDGNANVPTGADPTLRSRPPFPPKIPPQGSEEKEEKRKDDDGFRGDYQLILKPSGSSKKQYKMMKQMTMLLRKNVKPCPENFFFYEDKCYRISTFKATKKRSGGLCHALGAKLTTIPSKAFLLRLVWEFANHPGFKDDTELLFWTSAELRDKTWYWAGTSNRVNFGKDRERRQLRTSSSPKTNTQRSRDLSLLVTIANTLDQVLMRTVSLKDNQDKNHFICEMPACNSTKDKEGKAQA